MSQDRSSAPDRQVPITVGTAGSTARTLGAADDPLTAAKLSLAEAKKMVQEMLRKNRKHLPQFKKIEL